MRLTTRKLTLASIVAAAYVGLTLALAPISYGVVQLRVSEALCALPYLFPESALGLFVGCAIANLLGGATALDVVFGSLATLAAGLLTARLRSRPLACLPPVLVNTAVVGSVLAIASGGSFFPAFLVCGAGVFAGEAVAMYALGLPLLYALPHVKALRQYFRKDR